MIISLVEKLLTFLLKAVRLLGLSVGSYEANLTIEGFRGVMQFDENESINTDMRYAADARNFDTRDGALLPIVAVKQVTQKLPESGVIRSAAILKYPDAAPYDALVMFYGGNIAVTSFLKQYGASWFMHTVTTGNRSDYWQSAQYESNDTFSDYVVVGGQGLYTGSAKDPLREIVALAPTATPYAPTGTASIGITTPDNWNFGVLACYGERLWGSAIESEPDVVCYSAPFSPNDWSANVSIPEDGGGEIRIPSFDGERITALKPFGGTLLIFKEHHIYRLSGLSPDEYNVQEQYGGGTIFPNTIAVYQNMALFLTSNGVYMYDGVSVRPFQPYALRNLWRDANILGVLAADSDLGLHTPQGTVFDNKYIVSFPDGDSGYCTVVYDFTESKWSYFDSTACHLSPDVFLPYKDGLYILQHDDGASTLQRWYASIENVPAYETNPPEAFGGFDWVTPWSDMNAKDIVKNEFKMRFWIQTHMKAGDYLKLSVTVETERGSKTREIIFDRDVDEELKLRFHLSGRKVRMRFKLTDRDGNEEITSWCKIMGGLQLKADTSPD